MNPKAGATLLITALALAVFASPVVARATPRHYHRPASVKAEVKLRGTRGFAVRLGVWGRSTVLLASKRVSKLGEEGVTYSSRRRAGPTDGLSGGKLNVRVGRLGRFRARFVPTSTRTREGIDDGCKGEPTTVEQGFFVGSLNFRGERGYTRVHARRARGTVTRIAAARCVTRSSSVDSGRESVRAEEAERKEDEFRLVAGDGTADTILRASREEVSKGSKVTPTSFLVSVIDEVGELAVTHSAFVLDFHFDPGAGFRTPNLIEPLAEATIKPRAPFSGSAGFLLEDAGTASWTGELAVELPGLGRVPLTGNGFAAGLCKGRSNCTRTLSSRLTRILKSEAGFGARSGTISLVGSEAFGI